MRLIDANALDKFMDAAEKEATKNRKYVLASAINTIRGNIRNFPSAQSEWKRGRWIFKAEEFYKAVNEKGGGVNEDTPFFVDDIACSECLSMFSVIDNEAERFNFCPNCGADMRGGESDG